MKIKRFFVVALIMAFSVTTLSGCSVFDGVDAVLSDNVDEADSNEMVYNPQTHKGIMPELNYYYSILDDEKRGLYNIIYNAIMAHSQSVKLDKVDYDVLDYCFNCVLRDHPEIYYVYGYTYTQNRITEKVNEFTPNYNFTADELQYCDTQIAAYVNDFLTKAPVNGSDYEKIKYIYEYVPLHITYDQDIISNQSIYGAFVAKRCACNGYAKAVQYLANMMGIQCMLQVGEATNAQSTASHAWNLVYIDGRWYQVDTTWADHEYKAGSDVVSSVAYDYLCANDSIMFKDHTADDFTDYPKCNSLDMYYYVQEKTYMTNADDGAIAEAFSQSKKEGKNFVMFKCASYDVQQSLKQKLSTNNEIFKYVTASNANCSEYRDTNILIYYW